MLNVENRTPYPGKEGRVKLTQDDGQVIEGVLEMDDDATAPGTPWNRQSGRLLQADIRSYPVAEGQTITAGDVVDVVDGNAQKTLTPQANVETVLYTVSVSAQTSITSVSQNRALIFIPYSQNWLCCLYDCNTDSVVDRESPPSGGNADLTSDKLSDNHVIAGTTSPGSGSFIGYICDISEDSVSISQYSYIQDSTIGTGGSINYGKVIALSANSFLAVYNRSGLRAKVCTVSGTSISAGTEISLSSNTSAAYISATRLPDSGTTRRVCVCYSDGGDSNKGKAVIVSIDASNNITFGTPVVFNSGATANLGCGSDDSGNVYVAYSNTVSGNLKTAVKSASTSQNTISFYSNELILDEVASNRSAVTLVENSIVVSVGYSNKGISYVLSGNPGNLSVGGNYQYKNSESLRVSASAINNSGILLAYGDRDNSNYGTATTLTVEGNQIAGSFLDTSKDAIALQGGTAGQNIEVIYSGTVAADWVTEGQIISSPGVYGAGVLDGVLQVWSKDRPGDGLKYAVVEYTGTKQLETGSSAAKTIEVGFYPIAFFISATNEGDYHSFGYTAFAVRKGRGALAGTSGNGLLQVDWTDTGFTFYALKVCDGDPGADASAIDSMNSIGKKYHCLVLGAQK